MKNKYASNQENLTLNKLFGIYVDWQIENNLIEGLGKDPHDIKSFEDFVSKESWRIVEIIYNGQKMFCADIVLPKFSLLNKLNIKVEKVLESELAGREVEQKLKNYKAEYKKSAFDILQYYMERVPWNLVDPDVINNSSGMLILDESFFNHRIIIKVMTKTGNERIMSVNDIYNGGVEDYECLLDATQYDEDVSLQMERFWSEKLGITVLGDDEEIDTDFKYRH